KSIAPTSASGAQPSDQDNWDNGRLARGQQLLTEIVLRNKLTTLVFDGDTTCRVLEQVLLRSYGVQTQGVDNGMDAIALIAFGNKADSLNGSGCKILGVTACSGESERQAFLAIGVDVFIEKPLDPEHLVPILRELDGE
ncbi:hypothetical protein Golob_020312, partial [Gossypium lobatum]|nr:hypothetical protein [Gossypium lobatum]